MNVRSIRINTRVAILYLRNSSKLTISKSGMCSIEDSCGISAFANTANGVSGIIKQRYTDFIVREVNEVGVRAYVRDTGADKFNDTFPSSRANDKSYAESLTKKIDTFIEELHSLKAIDASFPIDELRNNLENCLMKNPDSIKEFCSFACASKELRTSVHQLVRNYFTV